MRRDYRKRIDNYHINSTDNKFYEDKVLRVVKTRAKADQIKAEANQIALEKAAENQFAKERQAAYKAELDALAAVNNQTRNLKRTTKYESERMHRGLPIGERDRRKYDKNIMKTLRNSIQEKFNFRKKLDQLSKSSNLNDFMAYKTYLDGVQQTLITQSKKRKESELIAASKASSRSNISNLGNSRRRIPKQKVVDKIMVENLANHDQNV